MGKVTRKRYGADFKAKVALDAIKGEQTLAELAELAAKHGIHQTMIAAWKRQAPQRQHRCHQALDLPQRQLERHAQCPRSTR
jgi:transposase-like protein